MYSVTSQCSVFDLFLEKLQSLLIIHGLQKKVPFNKASLNKKTRKPQMSFRGQLLTAKVDKML